MPNLNDSVLLSYAENEQVLNLLPIPIAVLKGDLYVTSFANDAMCELWKRHRSVSTIGVPLTTVFPETNCSFLIAVFVLHISSSLNLNNGNF